jgi:hypothetical protein
MWVRVAENANKHFRWEAEKKKRITIGCVPIACL